MAPCCPGFMDGGGDQGGGAGAEAGGEGSGDIDMDDWVSVLKV